MHKTVARNHTDRAQADEQTARTAHEAIEEARMVLPGIQALFGFQLIASFNERFQQLTGAEQVIHLTALVLLAISITLIMTPAAYHRLAEHGTVSRYFVRLASWLIAAAMVPLMLALALDVYLVGRMILNSAAASASVAGALLLLIALFWFAFPFYMRRRR